MTDITQVILSKDIRSSWQARCLYGTDGKLWNVVHAVLWHEYGRAMPVLLQVVYPGFSDITRPFLIGGAQIIRNGKVICKIVKEGAHQFPWTVIYDSEGDLIKEFRDLADRLKLTDKERIEMTAAVRKWVVADLRIDHMGRKLAS